MQPSVDPGVLTLLTGAFSAQIAARTARSGTPLPADRLDGDKWALFQSATYGDDPPLAQPSFSSATVLSPSWLAHQGYSCEALLPGGEALNDLGWSTLRLLQCGVPPWSTAEPMPVRVMTRIAQAAGWSDADMDRLALWYVECGGQFVTWDRCRSYYPQAVYPAGAPGAPGATQILAFWPAPLPAPPAYLSNMVNALWALALAANGGSQSNSSSFDFADTLTGILGFIDGDGWSGRVWPKSLLDAPVTTRDGVSVPNAATFLTLAPIGWRADGVALKVLSDPTVSPYLASLGVASASDLYNSPRLTQLAFEAALGANNVALLRDFTIGPEREWCGNFALCGGSISAITTMADLINFYIPSDLVAYFNKVKSFRSWPSFQSLGFNWSGSYPGADTVDAAGTTLANAFIAILATNRCLPAGEKYLPVTDMNYCLFLKRMLIDGPGYANFRPWPSPTFSSGTNLLVMIQPIVSIVELVLGAVLSAYSGGTLGPVVALVSGLVNQALTLEQLAVSMVNGMGWNAGVWHGLAGLSNTLNSQQGNVTRLETGTLSLVNGVANVL